MKHTRWIEDQAAVDEELFPDIDEMIKEKGKTCISIIVPTHRLGQDRKSDRAEIGRSVIAAKQVLNNKPGGLSASIDELMHQIDFRHNKEGIGLFVSPSIKKIVKFPFPVSRKIVINNYFHLHDILYTDYYRQEYYLLDISKNEIHLFRGLLDHLDEIRSDSFPKKNVEDYEYNKPAQSNSGSGYAHVKAVEKDKTTLNKIRLRNQFIQVDRAMTKYLLSKNIPLLLCGPKEDISIYKSLTGFPDSIAGTMGDNYKSADIRDLEILAWVQIKLLLDERKLKLVGEIEERIGEGLAVYGVDDVWKAANEGRGFKLLVEKDYSMSTFFEAEESHDLVNAIVTTVLEKKGKVIIVEKDTLRDYKRIVLLNRY